MSSLGTIGIVARREVAQRLRSRSFLAFTALIAVGVLAVGTVYRLVSDPDQPTATVALVAPVPPGLTDALTQAGAANGITITATTVPDQAAADAAIDDGSAQAAIDPASTTVTSNDPLGTTLHAAIDVAWQATQAAQAAQAAGLSPAQVQQITSPPALQPVVLQPDDGTDGDSVGLIVGFGTAILLFISVSTFGGYVLSGVVEEKTSAVVEVLLAQVRAHQLLAGKVLGIGVAAVLQLVVAVAAAVASLLISGASIPGAVWVSLPATVGWFIAGFALYSTLFALAGSFVSRPEDAQAAAAPISICFMAGYLLVFFAGADPDGFWATALSLLPPSAPLMMPLRMATGAASPLEVAIAAVLLVASVWLVLRAAGGVYARSLLHRGSRISWRRALTGS